MLAVGLGSVFRCNGRRPAVWGWLLPSDRRDQHRDTCRRGGTAPGISNTWHQGTPGGWLRAGAVALDIRVDEGAQPVLGATVSMDAGTTCDKCHLYIVACLSQMSAVGVAEHSMPGIGPVDARRRAGSVPLFSPRDLRDEDACASWCPASR